MFLSFCQLPFALRSTFVPYTLHFCKPTCLCTSKYEYLGLRWLCFQHSLPLSHLSKLIIKATFGKPSPFPSGWRNSLPFILTTAFRISKSQTLWHYVKMVHLKSSPSMHSKAKMLPYFVPPWLTLYPTCSVNAWINTNRPALHIALLF